MLLIRVVNREARSGSRCDEIRTRASQQGLGWRCRIFGQTGFKSCGMGG
jgi:hypothetical protein